MSLYTTRGKRTTYLGVTGDQTVVTAASNTPAHLHRIVIGNAAAAVGTVTVKDGGTTVATLTVGASTSLSIECGWTHASSIIVNPSAATLSVAVVWVG